jgi:osmotically inducible lipoprotein OsmB
MKHIATSALLATAIALSACAGQTPTQQRVLSGAAIGGLGGTAIGAIAGNAGLGAAIGVAAGATGGFIYDQHRQAEMRSYDRGYQSGMQAARTP